LAGKIKQEWPANACGSVCPGLANQFAALSDFASYKQVLANLKSDPALFTYLDSIEIIEAIPDIFFNPLKEKLKIFLYD